MQYGRLILDWEMQYGDAFRLVVVAFVGRTILLSLALSTLERIKERCLNFVPVNMVSNKSWLASMVTKKLVKKCIEKP